MVSWGKSALLTLTLLPMSCVRVGFSEQADAGGPGTFIDSSLVFNDRAASPDTNADGGSSTPGVDAPGIDVEAQLQDAGVGDTGVGDAGVGDAAGDMPDGAPKPLELVWHQTLGGPQWDYSYDVAVDKSGNIYVAGAFQGTADLGDGPVTSKGGYDVFLTSFDATGALRWQKVLGGSSTDRSSGVVVDGSGNVTLTGDFEGTADLGDDGSATSKGGYDIFITSFSSAGIYRWQKTLGGSSNEESYGVSVDGDDNLYVTGDFEGTADLGGGALTVKGRSDVFITSLSSTGTHRWQKALGGTLDDSGHDLTVDSNGDVYLIGDFQGIANLGGGDLSSKGSSDIFISSFTSAGVHRWQQALGGPLAESSWGVTNDHNGNITLTGSFEDTADLGGGDLSSKGNSDVFITSYSSTGVHRWQKALGGALADSGYDVAVDDVGNVFVTGSFFEAADLGGGDLMGAGNSDIFITSFTSLGAHRWQKALGGPLADSGYDIAIEAGNVTLTGIFQGTANLGGSDITSKGSSDVFLVTLGTATWVAP
ncbi:MAG: SBBP repeat-containing protein [Deltaproteobacteria bacterium]|nr:SBBP repeat-containing protein [Deltaproteobacteria bacterium]